MTALRIVCAWLRVQAWQWARDRAMARARRTLRRHDAIVAARAHGRLMQARIDLDEAERKAKGD